MARLLRSVPVAVVGRSKPRPARTDGLWAASSRRPEAGRRGANTAEVIILSAVAALTLILGVRLFG